MKRKHLAKLSFLMAILLLATCLFAGNAFAANSAVTLEFQNVSHTDGSAAITSQIGGKTVTLQLVQKENDSPDSSFIAVADSYYEVSGSNIRMNIPETQQGIQWGIKVSNPNGASFSILIDGTAQEVNGDGYISLNDDNLFDKAQVKNGVLMANVSEQPGGGQQGGGQQGGGQQEPGNQGQDSFITIKFDGIDTPFENVTSNTVIKNNDIDLKDLKFTVTELKNGQMGGELQGCSTIQGQYTPDAEGRNPLEVRVIAKTENSITINLENHADPMFYFTNITFANDKYLGVEIASNVKPFMFDSFIAGNVADISASTAENPAEFNVYFGSDTIEFNNVEEQAQISKIELGPSINPSAVTIDGLSVKINSDFYNEIPIIITLEDGTKGYVTIHRLGIEINAYEPNTNNNFIFHGTQNGSSLAGTKYEGKYNITATFYFDAEKSYEDYEMVSIATFADGHTETSVVTGFAETPGDPLEEVLKAGDYVLWSGNKDDAPISVSVTAVPAGTFESDTFGGVTFGSGEGVVKTFTDR